MKAWFFFMFIYSTWLGHSNLNSGSSWMASIIYILHFNSNVLIIMFVWWKLMCFNAEKIQMKTKEKWKSGKKNRRKVYRSFSLPAQLVQRNLNDNKREKGNRGNWRKMALQKDAKSKSKNGNADHWIEWPTFETTKQKQKVLKEKQM